tara:strand:+ start:19848 stop:22238 length:2391 start_codon:yes stop_codon:yes gene_type:complete
MLVCQEKIKGIFIVKILRNIDVYAVLLLSACVYFTLYIYADGMPYVLDGNETFSSILHAKNLLSYDWSFAKGLADETANENVAAHSFVHTHQGNFPRIFAALIYLVGVTTPEMQILVTTLIVGVPSIALIYIVFKKHVNKSIAFVTISMLLTDYILFLQWQVVTYRVWHTFFIAACLWSVSSYRSSRNKNIFFAFFGLWYFLFYYELSFAIFTAVTVGMWSIWLFRSELRVAIKIVGAQFVGSLAGALTVVFQLILYLGWDGFLEDLSLTYATRNEAVEDRISVELVRQFMDANHIVFFQNAVDSGAFRSARFVFDIFGRWGTFTYSPGLGIALLAIAFSAMLWASPITGKFLQKIYERSSLLAFAVLLIILFPNGSGLIFSTVGFAAILFLPMRNRELRQRGNGLLLWFLLFGSLFIDKDFLKIDFSVFQILLLVAITSVLSISVFWLVEFKLAKYATGSIPERIGKTHLLVLGVIVLLAFSNSSIDASADAFWEDAFGGVYVYQYSYRAIICFSAVLATVFIMLDFPLLNEMKRLKTEIRNVAILLMCAFTGILMVVFLLPGYLYSGYLVRNCSFLVIFTALMSSTGLVWIVKVCAALPARSFASLTWKLQVQACRHFGVALVILVGGVWGYAQLTLFKLVPPNGVVSLYGTLAKMPGATIVSNNYATPYHVMTGGWAYMDGQFGRARIIGEGGSKQYKIDNTYLWFADRTENKEYLSPDLYVCQTYESLSLRMKRVVQQKHSGYLSVGCAREVITQLAMEPNDGVWPDHRMIATDAKTDGENWAIIELDKAAD